MTLGHLLHLSSNKFGIWAGVSIQAVPQVVAAGFAYSAVAGKVATATKLARVLLLAPLMLLLHIFNRRQGNNSKAWYSYISPMIIGFVCMAVLNSFGLFNVKHVGGVSLHPQAWLQHASDFLIVMAMLSIGLATNLRKLLQDGHSSLLFGLLLMLVPTSLSLAILLIG